jgi:polysaccharide biosynthesis transport protein
MPDNIEPAPRAPQSLVRIDETGSRSVRTHISGRAQFASRDANSNLKPAFFLWVFQQWWMILVPVSLALAVAAAAAVILTYKPDYKASALIMIEESPQYIAFSNEARSGGTARYVETQLELLRSPVVLEILLSIPEIANNEEIARSVDQVSHIRNSLSITQIGDSELYNVGYLSKSPAHAAQVANAVVSEYLKIQERTEYDRFQRVIDLLEQERRNRSLAVERLRQRVVELSKDVTGRDPFGFGTTLDAAMASSPFAKTYHELNQAEVELEVLKAQLQSIQESSMGTAERGEKSGRLDFEIARDTVVLKYEADIATLERAVEERKSTFAENVNPAQDDNYRKLLQEIQLQQDALKKYKADLRQAVVAQLRDKDRAEREESTSRLEQEIALLETRKDSLTKKYKEELARVQSGNSKSVELTFAEAELEREEKVFEMIAGRKLAMQTESRAPARVTVRQNAAVPALPISKVPVKLLIMACAVCAAGPFGLAVLRELSIRRISDVEQLSRESSVRVIGEVSHFPIRRAAANSQALPPKLRKQMFVYLESIDSLRTNLWLAEPKSNSRVLVVTSAAAAEGKTCLATSLAVSIGNAEKKPVLVIDGDMRSPDVATVLGTRDRPGLAELLSNQASLSDVVQRVGKTNTYVIAAGRLKGNPHHLVRDERIAPILAQLRTQFSTIVVDTPPVFGGSESLVFAKSADSVVISVMRDVSRSKQLRSVVERLERSGAKVAGAVLNGTPSSSYAYSYGYGYYSGQLMPPDA